MNKKILKIMCLISLMSIATACEIATSVSNSSNVNPAVSSSSNNNESTTSSSKKDENSSSTSTSTSSSSNSNVDSSSSSSSSVDSSISEEDKYLADPAKRVTITLNVSLPDTENEVYVIGDFNNWGNLNSLNDTAYRVNEGTITISNVEENETYSYMYVQKIKDATYTYNFARKVVDSENNRVIGYTSSGQLISQYCVTQTDEAFTFTASKDYVSEDTVSNWTNPIYGQTIEVSDPNSSYEVPTAGYNLCIQEHGAEKPYYVPLQMSGETDFNGRTQYVAYSVALKARSAFTIYDGNSDVEWAETNLESSQGAGSNFIANSDLGIVCLKEGTYDIYIKLKYEDNAIYIAESNQNAGGDNTGGSTGSVDAPTSGYALKVTDSSGNVRYVSLTPVDEFEGFTQHFGDNVSLNVGDVIILYNCDAKEEWVEDTLNPAGQSSKFTVTASGIQCNVSGVYDIYVKMKYGEDEIYIGNESGA